MIHLICCWFTPDRVIALATSIYACFTIAMYLAIRRQAKLMHDSVVSTFRPRLAVRRVFLRLGTAISTAGVPDAHPWKVDFIITNIGGSTAHIEATSFVVTVLPDEELPIILPYAQDTTERNVSLQAGEEREFSVELEKELADLFKLLGVRGGHLQHQGIAHVNFFGYAKYADDLGIVRKTAVLRHYNIETGRFSAVPDPDYEYAD
ncbi:MAG: hypothetical protein ACLQVL_06240 [Terriglobia bacterium]